MKTDTQRNSSANTKNNFNHTMPINLRNSRSPDNSKGKSQRYATSKSPTQQSISTVCHREDCYEHKLQNNIKQLKNKRDRMYACVDLFELMRSNDMVLRCLQHNNALTLYCQTERRILCTNCTFGLTKHRMHKVIPLPDCSQYIVEDNQNLKDILDTDLECLDLSIKNCTENIRIVESQMKKSFNQLDLDFRRQADLLTAKYEQQTKRVHQRFTSLLNKSRKLRNGVEEFKNKIISARSRLQIAKPQEPNENEKAIIKQVLCVNLSETSHFQVRKITNGQLPHLAFKTCI